MSYYDNAHYAASPTNYNRQAEEPPSDQSRSGHRYIDGGGNEWEQFGGQFNRQLVPQVSRAEVAREYAQQTFLAQQLEAAEMQRRRQGSRVDSTRGYANTSDRNAQQPYLAQQATETQQMPELGFDTQDQDDDSDSDVFEDAQEDLTTGQNSNAGYSQFTGSVNVAANSSAQPTYSQYPTANNGSQVHNGLPSTSFNTIQQQAHSQQPNFSNGAQGYHGFSNMFANRNTHQTYDQNNAVAGYGPQNHPHLANTVRPGNANQDYRQNFALGTAVPMSRNPFDTIGTNSTEAYGRHPTFNNVAQNHLNFSNMTTNGNAAPPYDQVHTFDVNSQKHPGFGNMSANSNTQPGFDQISASNNNISRSGANVIDMTGDDDDEEEEEEEDNTQTAKDANDQFQPNSGEHVAYEDWGQAHRRGLVFDNGQPQEQFTAQQPYIAYGQGQAQHPEAQAQPINIEDDDYDLFSKSFGPEAIQSKEDDDDSIIEISAFGPTPTAPARRLSTPPYNKTSRKASPVRPRGDEPDMTLDISQSLRFHWNFQERVAALIPKLPNTATFDWSRRYWIAVLLPEKKPKNAHSEKDFVWMKGNKFSTVATVWHTFMGVGFYNPDDYAILLGNERVEMEDRMEELDYFSDRLCVFKVVSKGDEAAKGKSLVHGLVRTVIELD